MWPKIKGTAERHVVLYCGWMNSCGKERRSPNNAMWWDIKWDPFPMNTTVSWSSRQLLLFRNISNLVFYVRCCEYVSLCHSIFPPYLNKEIWRFSVSLHKIFTFLPLNSFHFLHHIVKNDNSKCEVWRAHSQCLWDVHCFWINYATRK